jgi:hypothetical protein
MSGRAREGGRRHEYPAGVGQQDQQGAGRGQRPGIFFRETVSQGQDPRPAEHGDQAAGDKKGMDVQVAEKTDEVGVLQRRPGQPGADKKSQKDQGKGNGEQVAV